jgi:rare lipoprotein A
MHYLSLLLLIGIILLQTGCATDPETLDRPIDFPGKNNPQAIPDAQPYPEPLSQYGNPVHYDVYGKRYYVLNSSKDFKQEGIASWYGKQFHGRKTSNGETYDMFAMTAAHKTLPLPTYVKVTNQRNGLTTIVRVNDRGPFHSNRIIDLSYAAALKLELTRTGTTQVVIEAIDTNPDSTLQEQPLQETNIEQAIIQPVQQEQATQGQFVQLGVFSEISNAKRMQNKISTSSLPTPKIISVNINKTDLYRVLIGPLTSEKQIEKIKDKLSQMGIQSTKVTASILP